MTTFNAPTNDELMSFNYERLRKNVGITDFSPGSFVRGILDAFALQHIDLTTKFDEQGTNFLLSRASGQWLDMWGDIVGVPRLEQKNAEVNADDHLIKFYTYASNFGAINSGNGIQLYPNTSVSTATDINGRKVTWLLSGTISELLLDSNVNYKYVSAVSSQSGKLGNVPENSLTVHLFSNYTDYGARSLLVTNVSSIVGGRGVETDDNYRFRITNALKNASTANRTAIMLAGLNVPGISFLKFLPYQRGIGTSDVLVISNTSTTPQSLVDKVQQAIDGVVGEGNSIYCKKPQESGVEVHMTIKYKQGITITSVEDGNIKDKVRRDLTNYINNIRTGQSLIINEMVQRVMQVDDRIYDLGSPSQPFDNIFIYKYSTVEGERIRRKTSTNYTTDVDETLMVEPSVDEAIIIDTATIT